MMLVNLLRNQPVRERDKSQYEQEDAAGLIVEEPADGHEIDIAQMKPSAGRETELPRADVHYQRKQRIDHREECPEIKLGK